MKRLKELETGFFESQQNQDKFFNAQDTILNKKEISLSFLQMFLVNDCISLIL